MQIARVAMVLIHLRKKVNESINNPFLPLFEGHFIGEASNRVWYEGWVGDVPDCPAGQNKGSLIFKAYQPHLRGATESGPGRIVTKVAFFL